MLRNLFFQSCVLVWYILDLQFHGRVISDHWEQLGLPRFLLISGCCSRSLLPEYCLKVYTFPSRSVYSSFVVEYFHPARFPESFPWSFGWGIYPSIQFCSRYSQFVSLAYPLSASTCFGCFSVPYSSFIFPSTGMSSCISPAEFGTVLASMIWFSVAI